MDGILRCSRYAFGPNRLHYCGPDANKEMWEYINDGYTDAGLRQLIERFEVLYPYLRRIGASNHIKDPLDPRVVDAYWIGNSLLDAVGKRTLHEYFVDDLLLKKRLPIKQFRILEERIDQGMLPSHNFHVINVPKRMGNLEMEATLEHMDACRISAGEVTAVSGPSITVEYEPLTLENRQLTLGKKVQKNIVRRLEADYDIESLVPGQVVTMHWDVPCEVISKEAAQRLHRYTLMSIRIANQN